MSVYSSAASSAGQRPPRPSKPNADGEGEGEDFLDQRQSVESGVFGVLFTLSKEKSGNNWKFALLKVVLDFWQLFVTVIDPAQGWNIDPDSRGWQVVGVWNFTFLSNLSYTVYVAVLYCVVCALLLNLALCVWVALSFKKRQFDYVWPIQVLRLFTSVFFQAFDVASLNLLQLGMTCQIVGVDSDIRGHMLLFPDVSCASIPHLIHLVVSAITLLVFVLVALLLNMSEVELNPLSRRPTSLAHCGPEVWGFGIKTAMTLVTAFTMPGWLRVESILLTALAALLAWIYIRWAPHLVGWMNHVKVGTYTAVLGSSALAIVVLFHPGVDTDKPGDLQSFQKTLTTVMLVSLVPFMLVGALVSYLRCRIYMSNVLSKYRTAASDANPKDVYEFKDPRDVEIASRVARKWIRRDVVDPMAATEAEVVIKAGLILFPNNAYMTLVHANFLIDVKDNSPAGYRQLQAATKLKPSMMCRFMVFVREQEQQQRAASSHTGGAGQLDLVSYVEFQKSQRMVMRHHKDAMMAICAFWQCLLRNNVSFKSLAQALNKIEKSVSNAEMAYMVALERYTDSHKLMRLYAKFLQTVKNDPWRATEFLSEAERLEAKQQEEGGAQEGEGGIPRVDDSTNAVIVINAKGVIQLTNRATGTLFGYKKGELEAKNITMLMPAPFSTKHTSCVLHYANNSSNDVASYVVGKTRLVIGLHQDRYGLPVKLLVTKASGTGEDATFMGLMEAVQADPSLSLVWVNHVGTISCVDQRFGMWFGYNPGELIGASFSNYIRVEKSESSQGEEPLMMPQMLLSKLMEECHGAPPPPAEGTGPGGGPAADKGLAVPPFVPSNIAAGMAIAHKYGGNVRCQVCMVMSGTINTPVHMLMLKRVNPEPSLMMVSDIKGALRHMSSDMAQLLGYVSGAPNLENMKITDLMPPTWGCIHPKWIKEQDPEIPAFSCRQAQALTHHLQDIKGKPVPVRLTVETTDEHDGEPLHVVRLKRSSPQQALDDRRLQLNIDHRGIVTAVVGATPASLFGLDPKGLVGKALQSIVPLLADPEANGGNEVDVDHAAKDEFHELGLDAFATPALSGLIKKAMDRPGYSWRVGVSPPGEEANIRKRVKDQALVQSMLSKLCKPAVMQVDATTSSAYAAGTSNHDDRPGSASGSHLTVVVSLWRADILSACVEIDKDGAIQRVENEAVCPPGLLFGVPSLKLRGPALLQFLGAANLAEVGADADKRGGLKSSTAAAAAGKLLPPRVLSKAIHYDQQPLAINCQLVVKGLRRWLLMHVSRPSKGSPVVLANLLPAGAPTAADSKHQSGPAMITAATLGPPPAPPPMAVTMPAPGVTMGAKPLGIRSVSGRGSPHMVTLMEQDSGSGSPPATPPDIGAQQGEVGARHSNSSKNENSDNTGQMAVNEMAVHQAADSAFIGRINSKSTRFNLPHAVEDRQQEEEEEGDEDGEDGATAMQALVRGSSPAASSKKQGSRLAATPPLASPARLTAPQEEDEEQQEDEGGSDGEAGRSGASGPVGGDASARPSADGAQVDEEGEEGDAEAGSNGGKKAGLTKTKIDRISAWINSDGEKYPVQVTGQDLDPTSPLARGLMVNAVANVAEPAYLPVGSGLVGSMEVTEPIIFRGRRSMQDDSMMGNKPKNKLSVVLEKHNRVAPDSPKPGSGPLLLTMSGPITPGAPPMGYSASGARRSSALWRQTGDEEGGGSMKKHQVGDDDDGHSEGGDSAGSGASKMSGMSGLSGMSGDNDDNGDYRRGKRYRKLAKMLDGAEAQRVTNRFKVHTMCLVALLLITQTVSFAMTVIGINAQMTFMTSLSSSGYVSRYNMLINLYVRSIDNILINYTAPGLYQEGLQHYLDQVAYANDEIQFKNEFIYFDMEGMTKLDDSYGLRTAFDLKMRNISLYLDDYGNPVWAQMSLWEMFQRFHSSIKNYLENHAAWHAVHNTTSNMPDFYYINQNGPVLYVTYREVLDSLLYKAVANTREVNKLHIIFLVVEGCVMCTLVALYYTILLRQVSSQRYALYSVFIIIPIGLVRALSNQSVKLLDDSESEDDDDGPGGAGGGGEESAQEKEANRPDAKELRKEIRNLNKKKTNDLDNSVRGAPSPGPGSTAINIKGMGGDKPGSTKTFGQRFVSSLRSILGIATARSGSKRQLVRDSRETIFLLLPIVLWGLLVVAIYTISFVMLEGISGPVAEQNVINYVAGRTLRAAYFAQEYVTLAPFNAAKYPSMSANVLTYASKLEDAFRAALYGQEAYTLYNVNETFILIDEGATYSSKGVSSILYATDTCMRLDPTKCRPEGDPYRAISGQGLVAMMLRYIDQQRQLAKTSFDNLRKEALSNEHWQYIWNVGTMDMLDAIVQLVTAHEDFIVNMFTQVRMLHIVLFVLSWIFACLFLLLLLRPLLKRTRKETRRIAELLSQLPPELNVEKLVMVTLKVQATNKEVKEGTKNGEEAKDWNRIVRSNSSVQHSGNSKNSTG